jgi:hypothetical protein
VVVAARNALRWLPGAIASIGGSAQLEIIAVDVASEDGTANYLRSIAATDRRIRVIHRPEGSIAAGRNAGLTVARGALTAFLEPQDRWRREKLARQIEFHRINPDIGFSFTDHRRFAEDGSELVPGFARCPAFAARHAMRHEGFVLDGDAQASIYAEPVVVTSAVMARTALLRAVGGFNEQLGQGEDWDLWLHLAACAPVGCLPKPLTDRLLRPLEPGPEAAARQAARRRIANAYAAPVAALDRGALALCRTSQLGIEADGAALAGYPLQAARLRLAAFARQPSRVLARAAALDLLGVLGRPAVPMRLTPR